MNRLEAQMLLIREILGLNPCHDPVEAIRVLYQDGKEAFERLRGERCSFASNWRPELTNRPAADNIEAIGAAIGMAARLQQRSDSTKAFYSGDDLGLASATRQDRA